MEERDFSHVKNMVDGFVVAAEKAEFHGEVLNVASDEIVSIRTLAEMLCEIMQASPQLQFSGQRRVGDSHRLAADTSRMRALGYRPRVSLIDGLRDTVEWFLRSPH